MCECIRRDDGTWHVDECCAAIMDEYHAGTGWVAERFVMRDVLAAAKAYWFIPVDFKDKDAQAEYYRNARKRLGEAIAIADKAIPPLITEV